MMQKERAQEDEDIEQRTSQSEGKGKLEISNSDHLPVRPFRPPTTMSGINPGDDVRIFVLSTYVSGTYF